MGEYGEKGSTVMAKELLDVKQLFVNVEDKEILHGVDLKIGKGETHVLMGPNGAGKSTLGYVLMGNPKYEITQGNILFKGKDTTVIPNAIEVDKFLFDREMRKYKREELGLKDEFVLGHVGRLSYQKNHKFLIEIFSEVHKKNKNTVLLLIGVGEKEQEIKEQIRTLGLDNAVRFLGSRSDVNELYQAMDVFVMPSFFEGIPVTGVEAQFAELPCIFSTKVP